MVLVGEFKSRKYRSWSYEEKLRIVKRYTEDGIGQSTLAKEEDISLGMLHRWITKYLDGGEAALEIKRKPGNRYSALWTSKSLTEEERLRLIIQKQEIEIERLKKGYQVKGVGVNKEFVTIKDASLK